MSEFKSSNPDPKLMQQILWETAGENKDAFAYIGYWIKACQLIDDLFDEIEDWKNENTYELAQLLLVDMPSNLFFHTHKLALLPLHVTVLNAWRDSNDWKESGDKPRKLHALVMCEQVSDIIILVAYLSGGYEHMRKVSIKVRELFLKEEIV
tara:strand:+ start:359 stop:814 length:456 start_codon:yes stop_codon:yes gene_type:complete